jgi:hypothetical protein
MVAWFFILSEKRVTLLRIANGLEDVGVDKVKIAMQALNQMKQNGMRMSKVHAYRILPQKTRIRHRVVACRNNRTRK